MAGLILLGGGAWFFNNALFNGKASTALTITYNANTPDQSTVVTARSSTPVSQV